MAGKFKFAVLSSVALKPATSLFGKTSDPVEEVTFTPYNWLKDAKIYNKKWEPVPNDWLVQHADMIVLLFTAKGVNRHGILERFYHVYESTKFAHIPIEVIFVPMDETEEDAFACFAEQANWFTLHFDDTLVHTLKYMYEVSCIPHLIVIKANCEVISYNGIADLDLHGKNAVISWLTESPSTKRHRRRSEDADKYGPVWRFVKKEVTLAKYEYQKRFNSDGEPVEDHSHLADYHGEPEGYTAPAKGYSRPPKNKVKPLEVQTETETETSDTQSLETPKVPEGRSKSATITAPEIQGLQEDRSKSAGTRHSVGLRPSIVQMKVPDRSSRPSESQVPTQAGPRQSKIRLTLPDGSPRHSEAQVPTDGAPRHSKIRLSLPDDKLDGQSSETRPKTAESRPSDSNVQAKEARSKSAKFAD